MSTFAVIRAESGIKVRIAAGNIKPVQDVCIRVFGQHFLLLAKERKKKKEKNALKLVSFSHCGEIFTMLFASEWEFVIYNSLNPHCMLKIKLPCMFEGTTDSFSSSMKGTYSISRFLLFPPACV